MRVEPAAEPVGRSGPARAARVVFQDAVSKANIRLVDLDGIEAGEVTTRLFDGIDATGVGDQRMVDAARTDGAEENTSPIAGSRLNLTGIQRIVVVGIEGAASPESVVRTGGEENLASFQTFRDQLSPFGYLDAAAL